MLHIILLILKWILLSVLMLLGLVVVLIVLIAFTPIMYNINASYHDKPFFRAKVLFLCVSFVAEYNGKFETKLKVFGIPLHLSFGRKKKKKSVSDKEESEIEVLKEEIEKDRIEAETVKQEKTEVNKDETEEDTVKEEATVINIIKADKAEDAEDSSVDSAYEEESTEEEEIPKVKISLFHKIKCKFKRKYDKIKSVFDNIGYYHNLFHSKEFKDAFVLAKSSAKKLLKAILPRNWMLKAHFGFEDPATTGHVLSSIYPFYCLYGKHVVFETEYDRKVLELDFDANGHMSLITFLVARNFRQIIKVMERKGESHNGK